MSNEAVLGELIDGDGKRDAIHIAIAPVVADCRLSPGQDIGFVEEGNTIRVGRSDKPVGIVDPFLSGVIVKGQWFWMLLYPKSITSLRHDWSHPAFVDAPKRDTAASEQWLRDYADGFDVTYEEMMGAAMAFLEHGSYWSRGSKFEGEYVSDDFWNHFQMVTGRIVPEGVRGSFFSCAC